MKPLVIVALFACLPIAPTFAQDLSTIQYMVKNGVVIRATGPQGRSLDIPVTYKDDGASSTSLNGKDVSGKWRVDGDKFCTVNSMNPVENCFVVPPGKMPGDAFQVPTPALGLVTITINK